MRFPTWLKTLLVLAWLGCMAWLVRYEAYPDWFEDTVQGYKALARDLPAMRDSWMKVMADGRHVGFANSTIEMEEVEGHERLSIRSQLHLRVSWREVVTPLRFTSEIRLGPDQALREAEFAFSMGEYGGELRIVPAEGLDEYEMSGRFQTMPPFRRLIRIPPQAVLGSPLLDAGLQAVRPGQTLRIRTLDPFSAAGETRTMLLRGEEREALRTGAGGESVMATRISMQVGEMTLRAWVDDLGRVLRQETPFGLLLVAAPAQEAVNIPTGNAVDPLSMMKHGSLGGLSPLTLSTP